MAGSDGGDGDDGADRSRRVDGDATAGGCGSVEATAVPEGPVSAAAAAAGGGGGGGGGWPRTCLIIKKPNDSAAAAALLDIGRWLVGRQVVVLVEAKVLGEPALLTAADAAAAEAPHAAETPAYWLEALPQDAEAAEERLDSVDFAICLGGDGTILWLSGLFRGRVPPVISFALGAHGHAFSVA